jgi:tRNA G18 (ribose-2'-O)-methylase SpoU
VIPVAIESIDDPRVAEYRNVPDAALLRTRGVFVAEGRQVVRQLLTASRFRTRSVLVSPSAFESLRDVLETRGGLPVYTMPVERLEALVGFNMHRGCLAVGERPRALTVDGCLRDAAASRLLVVCERLGNADNMGAIFRNALAFGAGGVLLSPGCCDPLYRKSIRVSMGAALRVPFALDENWPGGLQAVKDAGFRMLCLTPARPSRTLEDALASLTPSAPIAVVLGHEGDGLSDGARRAADDCARIDMAADMDSLNVATAAGIALYACRRRLGWPANAAGW